MQSKFPPQPAPRSLVLPMRPSKSARDMLALRRSTGKANLVSPAPNEQELKEILTVAARVPDHRALNPWRFIIIQGENRAKLGHAMAIHYEGDAQAQAKAGGAFLRAPIVVAVIFSPKDDGRTPQWEQELSAGAVCYNVLLAANAAGWAGCWLTEWMTYNAQCHGILGLTGAEKPAGFIYLGTAKTYPQERRRPIMDDIISTWEA